MSDKTKVLSRNLKTKLFYDSNQELDLKKKNRLEVHYIPNLFTFQHTVQKSKSAVRAARKKNKPACKENPRGLLFCILYIKGLLLFL